MEISIPIIMACIGCAGGLLALWVKNLLDRMNSMEDNIRENLDNKVELEIDVVLEKVRNIERRTDSIDAKMDKLYDMLIEMNKK